MLRVLVVGDGLEQMKVLVERMRRRGAEVITASSFALASYAIHQRCFELVVTNFSPGADEAQPHLDLLRLVRQRCDNTGVIIISADDLGPAESLLMKEGALLCLSLPADADALWMHIQQYVPAQ